MTLRDKIETAALMYMDGASMRMVGEALGVTAPSICRLFRDHEFPTRTPSDAIVLAVERGRGPGRAARRSSTRKRESNGKTT